MSTESRCGGTVAQQAERARPTDVESLPVTWWLERSAEWRFASLLFQLPSPELVDELRAVGREVRSEWRDEAERLASGPIEDWQAEYHRVLGPGGCPASESSYDDNALAGRGPLMARVAGVYEAFAYVPHEANPEVADHLSHLLGFLGYLALKSAYARHTQQSERLTITSDAYLRFAAEHLATWIERFEDRIARTESPFYIGAGHWARRLCDRAGARLSR